MRLSTDPAPCAGPLQPWVILTVETSLGNGSILSLVPLLGELFARYEPAIRALPKDRPLSEQDLAGETFLLDADGRLEIYYAPMDWLRAEARVTVVGITPGRGTMLMAFQTVLDGLTRGRPVAEVMDDVKKQASFSGFRSQLVEWLAWLGIPAHLGVGTEGDVWQRMSPLIHPTSAVRYPVFIDGRNYSGRGPDLVKNHTLRRFLHDLLAPELAQIPDALVVPLGDKVSDALAILASDGLLNIERCLMGFPHPSGNNGHRMRKWAENRAALNRKATAWFERHPVGKASSGRVSLQNE
jgi:hypothetical protein